MNDARQGTHIQKFVITGYSRHIKEPLREHHQRCEPLDQIEIGDAWVMFVYFCEINGWLVMSYSGTIGKYAC